MNWINKVTPPGLKTIMSKKDTPDDLWVKCPVSGELIYRSDLEATDVGREEQDTPAGGARSIDQVPSVHGTHQRVGPFRGTEPDRRKFERTLAEFGHDAMAHAGKFCRVACHGARGKILGQAPRVTRRREVDQPARHRAQPVQPAQR
jgi:hypothetical protein